MSIEAPLAVASDRAFYGKGRCSVTEAVMWLVAGMGSIAFGCHRVIRHRAETRGTIASWSWGWRAIVAGVGALIMFIVTLVRSLHSSP